jgi:hypothetical protein
MARTAAFIPLFPAEIHDHLCALDLLITKRFKQRKVPPLFRIVRSQFPKRDLILLRSHTARLVGQQKGFFAGENKTSGL